MPSIAGQNRGEAGHGAAAAATHRHPPVRGDRSEGRADADDDADAPGAGVSSAVQPQAKRPATHAVERGAARFRVNRRGFATFVWLVIPRVARCGQVPHISRLWGGEGELGGSFVIRGVHGRDTAGQPLGAKSSLDRVRASHASKRGGDQFDHVVRKRARRWG